MRFQKSLFFLAAALIAALLIAQFWQAVPYEEQLIRIQAERQFGHLDPSILKEPLEIQAMLLDYSANQELVLKAWIALSKYPATRKILLQYGSEPEFKDVLLKYGDSVIPAIAYFMEHDIWSVRAMDASSKQIDSISATSKKLWDSLVGNPAPANPAIAPAPAVQLGATQRGWYAINFIAQEGHTFLGQFVVDNNNNVTWIQTDRILQGLGSFLAGGIRKLEVNYDLGEVKSGDVVWAAVDVAVFVGAFKLLRAGKAAAGAGREISLVSRTRVLAPKLMNSAFIRSIGKYGALAATAYIVVSHPSLVNSVLADAAKLLGVSPWLMQFGGWALIIFVLLFPFSWLLIVLGRMLRLGVSGVAMVRRRYFLRGQKTSIA